jgi:hypothetical protein
VILVKEMIKQVIIINQKETLLNLKILESNHLISTHESDTSPDQSDNETSNKVINII